LLKALATLSKHKGEEEEGRRRCGGGGSGTDDIKSNRNDEQLSGEEKAK
jgi:hypothetical protein